jgi:hypothetical protein
MFAFLPNLLPWWMLQSAPINERGQFPMGPGVYYVSGVNRLGVRELLYVGMASTSIRKRWSSHQCYGYLQELPQRPRAAKLSWRLMPGYRTGRAELGEWEKFHPPLNRDRPPGKGSFLLWLEDSIVIGVVGLLVACLVGSALGNLAAGQHPPEPGKQKKVVYFEQTL